MKKQTVAKERRQNVRFRIFSLVKHGAKPEVVTLHVDNIQNLSRGGLAFFTAEAVKEGSVLHLYFLPPNRMEPVAALGKVVRCPKVTDNVKAFEIGIQFMDLSDDAKLAIQELEIFSIDKQSEIQF